MNIDLSPRQNQVLEYIRKGLTNPQIAKVMDLSEGTVKIHVRALLRKADAKTRTELVGKI